MKSKTDWTYNTQFLDATEAADVYRRMLLAPWTRPDAEKMSACHYGLSYTHGLGGVRGEISIFPNFLKALAERITLSAEMPSNYVQCHRGSVNSYVRPHRDPRGMIVPMLTLGMERTFRVGGTYPEDIPKTQRTVESHIPEEEILMRHGDLITFNGGRTAHSMFPAAKDPGFNRNGFEFRISILFRWTTSIMRAMGPDRRIWTPAQVQAHEREYATVRKQFLEDHQPQASLF